MSGANIEARSTLHVPQRWVAIVFIAVAQLMIALDATIMNVALPSLQTALAFPDSARSWVITAYTVAFGSLLLLGGRLSDRLGHIRAFTIGLVGFATVSALGGMATGLVSLCAARAAQGAFAALLAPTALALVASHAGGENERGKTFALFGAIAGSGGVVGLVLGGFLTMHFGWRVCLWVNIPIAAIAALGTRTISDAAPPTQRRLDVLGALLVTCGVGALVAACSRSAASRASWSTLTLLVVAACLLALFVRRQARTAQPLLPLRILRDRQRVGAYASAGLAIAGMLGLYLSLSYYFQVVRGASPLRAGLLFVPLSAATFVSAQVVGRLLPHLGARTLIVLGLVSGSAAMLALTQLTPTTSYVWTLLPVELLLGIGMAAVFTPAISTATENVAREDAGIAAAMVHAVQQIGGSIGVAVLNSIAAAAAANRAGEHAAALVHGYAVAAGVAAAMFALAAVLAAGLLRPRISP